MQRRPYLLPATPPNRFVKTPATCKRQTVAAAAAATTTTTTKHHQQQRQRQKNTTTTTRGRPEEAEEGAKRKKEKASGALPLGEFTTYSRKQENGLRATAAVYRYDTSMSVNKSGGGRPTARPTDRAATTATQGRPTNCGVGGANKPPQP